MRIMKIMSIDFCSILLLDKSTKMLYPKIAYSINKGSIKTEPLSIHNSISGECILRKKTIYTKEVLKDIKYQYKDLAESEHLKSMLCIPFIVDNKAIGTLSVYTKKTRIFSQDELNLLEALADHAGIIIKKTELYNKITKDNENFSMLLEMGRILNATLQTEDLLKVCLEKTLDFTKADFGFILLIEDDTLSVKYAKGYGAQEIENIKLKIGEGVSGYAALVGVPVIINNVEQEPRYIRLHDEIKSEASIPIMRSNKVIGIIDLESKNYNNFTQYSKALELLTNQIAVAIENAKLYDEIRSFNEKLKYEIELATRAYW